MRTISNFPAPKSPDDSIWNKYQAAKYLRVSVNTLDRWRKAGLGPKAHKVGSQVRYFPQDVVDWISDSPTQAGGHPS